MMSRIAPTLAAAAMAMTALAASPAAAQARHPSPDSDAAHGPQKLVDKAVSVVDDMKRDPHIRALLARSAGVYVVPEYGRAGFIIGGRGGTGVVVAHRGKMWTSPAFYGFGGLSIGLQAGGAGGSIAFILMNHKAVQAFVAHNKVSFSANAGLSVVTYSAADQAAADRGDVVLWTNTKGAYAGATVEAKDINRDNGRTREFYGREVPTSDILNGRATAPGARFLQNALAN